MALPPLVKQAAEMKLTEYCRKRAKPYLADQLRIDFKFRGTAVTLFEARPSFASTDRWVEIPVAQFRFDCETGSWTLYCADRNSRWHLYLDLNPSRKIEQLLKEVDADPTGIFWG